MKPAPILIRLLANLIDSALFWLFSFLTKFFIPGVMYALDQTIPNMTEKEHSILEQIATVFFSYSNSGYLISFTILLYFVYFEQSEWQGTIGKKICKIKVVDTANKRLSLFKALNRYLVRIAPSLLFYYLSFFINSPACLKTLESATDLSTTCGKIVVIGGTAITLLWYGPIFCTKDNRTTYDILSNTKVVS
jgi:uncharacterized RDD family membrane protein YckC